jgi:hypothetical protein
MSMHNITWNGIRLRTQSYNVLVAEHQLELKRCYRDPNGIPVVMVPGFLENSQVFLPTNNTEAGLAPYLASLGYDVYLAEMRGKGNSWPNIGRRSNWGIHEAVCEDIPAHLGMVEKLRPNTPQFWIGQGMGGLLLSCSYARIEALLSPVMGIAHFAAARQCCLSSWRQTLNYQLWLTGMVLGNVVNGYVGNPFTDPVRRETRHTWKVWKRWHRGEAWLDPVDKLDYKEALQHKPLPPSLYIANHKKDLWGNINDCRAWVHELGPHDGRLVMISKPGGNSHNYSSRNILRHPAACDDHYVQLRAWLAEKELAFAGPVQTAVEA